MKTNRVHIAFGFHVNCYHSYRGDTNDAAGFGNDIRIIRHTIENLDAWNAKGVPVKGTWDFENAYSLEEILPTYAPDIIANVKRRCQEHGDENILMGYNNGAMSAMTKDEFAASVSLAIHNDKGSGLQDLFGSYAPIIRPQEVMFTPSEAEQYQKAGIEAVCLYYSCVPFDAFRTIVPQLSDGDAFNPLIYQWKDSSITILPTYSQSDVMDAGSLRYLVCDLHQQQEQGSIHQDVFLFINIDADSFLWEPLKAPKWIQNIPNCGGLNGLINEVQDLGFVTFDTPNGYLKDHPPVRTITFEEDVADGNFSGYASWAEKPFNRTVWTRLERARRMAEVQGSDADSASFDSRIHLLSTTHFGLASPVLNITREEKALQLSHKMMEEEMNCFPKEEQLHFKVNRPQTLFASQLQLRQGYCRDIRTLTVHCADMDAYTILPMDSYEDQSLKTIYLLMKTKQPQTECILSFEIKEPQEPWTEDDTPLTAGDMVLLSDVNGFPAFWKDHKQLTVLQPFLTYDGAVISFDTPKTSALPLGGVGRGMRYEGEIHLPEELTPGHYCYDFAETNLVDALVIRCAIQYPYTKEQDSISTSASNLGRFSDHRWIEAAPLAMTFTMKDSVQLTKRNFMDSFSTYPLADFWNSMPANKNIDSFNQQLTGGVLYLGDEDGGLAMAHARMVSSSMAHCPMRLQTKHASRLVTLNPYGTFFGQQRHYPTRGNGCVMDLYNITMPQAQSLAPAYNGAKEQFLLGLSWQETALAADVKEALCNFADGAVAYGGTNVTACTLDNSTPHQPEKNASSAGSSKSFATGKGNTMRFISCFFRLLSNIHHAQKKVKTYLSHYEK